MKDQIDSLLAKDMDRRDFLKHVAFGFAALTGVAGLLKTLNGLGKQPPQVAAGYGTNAYGGSPKDNSR